jgi:hypothetical protein
MTSDAETIVPLVLRLSKDERRSDARSVLAPHHPGKAEAMRLRARTQLWFESLTMSGSNRSRSER